MTDSPRYPEPERFNRAVRAGCTNSGFRRVCKFPECICKRAPRTAQATIDTWEDEPPGAHGEEHIR